MAKSTKKKGSVSVRFSGMKNLDKKAKDRIGKRVLEAVKAEVEDEVAGQVEDGWVAYCKFTSQSG
jgi:hypothetical protein